MHDRQTAILGRDLRANPEYELVLFDRLAAGQRELLAGLVAQQDADFYGVLVPLSGVTGVPGVSGVTGVPGVSGASGVPGVPGVSGVSGGSGGGQGIKAVCRETALLFLTLQQPGRLPAYVEGLHGSGTARLVAQLVADGVLQVNTGQGFACGAAALALLSASEDARTPGGRLGELSLAALRHGASLALDDPLLLSRRLYAYNRLPLTPAWKRRLPDAGAVEKLLGIAPGDRGRGLLTRSFLPLGDSGGWLSFRFLAPGAEAINLTSAAPTYKLYVSPLPAALADGFGDIVAGLADSRAPYFKIGSGATGLLRPDKIVAYFTSFERLAETAAALAPRFAGLPAHGVPFTAEIGAGGLLSWGLDPPRPLPISEPWEPRLPWEPRSPWEPTSPSEPPAPRAPWNRAESWRQWLTHRLARALLAARAGAVLEPWRFALERLRLEGVDSVTWTPEAGLFADPERS